MNRKTTVSYTSVDLACSLHSQLLFEEVGAGVDDCTSAALARFAVAQIVKRWVPGHDHPKRPTMALRNSFHDLLPSSFVSVTTQGHACEKIMVYAPPFSSGMLGLISIPGNLEFEKRQYSRRRLSPSHYESSLVRVLRHLQTFENQYNRDVLTRASAKQRGKLWPSAMLPEKC